jgi:hypothetical protein
VAAGGGAEIPPIRIDDNGPLFNGSPDSYTGWDAREVGYKPLCASCLTMCEHEFDLQNLRSLNVIKYEILNYLIIFD